MAMAHFSPCGWGGPCSLACVLRDPGHQSRCERFCLFPQVMQVLNADAIVVKLNSGDYKTIHLSSIRPPRLEGENTQVREQGSRAASLQKPKGGSRTIKLVKYGTYD